MQASKNIYSEMALAQMPRLLSLEDRNPFSPTYGCFNREYWLNKTTDFPSAITQFGVHSLSLVYANHFPENIYYRQRKILDWTLAGIEYWTKIQKNDGSFDEFYYNERGWAGPTGFLLYAVLDSYRMLKSEFPKDLEGKMLKAAHKSALFLAKYDEPSVLANHHAIAILAIYEAYLVLRDKKLLDRLEVRIKDFLSYCYDEGWSLEYGGADLGYLSATVSFLGKLHKVYQDERLYDVAKKAIEFTSYFVYPNGFYAGTIGSRQTLHFYPHGYEIFAEDIPLATAVAEKMLIALGEGKLVPPQIQSDRYFLYRIPEFLLSYLDYKERVKDLSPLPYEREPFDKFFDKAKIFVKKSPDYYLLVNLIKGGVVKLFNLKEHKLLFNDCGIIAETENSKAITTQWLDDEYKMSVDGSEILVGGNFHYIKFSQFTPFKMIIFRMAMITLGWHTKLAYIIKGWIRKILIWGSKPAPIKFVRRINFDNESLMITDMFEVTGPIKIRRLMIGDEFNHRYVPQSMYFQSQELEISGFHLTEEMLDSLNRKKKLTIGRKIDLIGNFEAKVIKE